MHHYVGSWPPLIQYTDVCAPGTNNSSTQLPIAEFGPAFPVSKPIARTITSLDDPEDPDAERERAFAAY